MINHSCYCIGPNIRQYFVRGGCITFKDHTLRFSQKHVNEARTGKKGIKLHLIFVSFYDTIRWPYYLDHNIFKTKCYCSLLSFLDSVNREPQEAPSTDWCHQIASNNPLLFSVTTSIQESQIPPLSSETPATIWNTTTFDCKVFLTSALSRAWMSLSKQKASALRMEQSKLVTAQNSTTVCWN